MIDISRTYHPKRSIGNLNVGTYIDFMQMVNLQHYREEEEMRSQTPGTHPLKNSTSSIAAGDKALRGVTVICS